MRGDGHGKGMWRQQEEQRPFDRRLFLRLLSYLVPFRGHVFWAVVFLLLATASSLAGPYFLKVAIDRYILPSGRLPAADRLQGLAFMGAAFLAVQLLNWVSSYYQTYFMSWAGQQAIYSLRQSLFIRLQRLGVNYFEGRPAGAIMSRVTNDVDTLSEMVSSGLVKVVGDLLTLGGIVAIMTTAHPRLALLSFITLPLLFYLAFGFRSRMAGAFRKVRSRVAEMNAFLQESISGVRVIKSLVREEENIARFDRTNFENYEANMEARYLFALFLPAVDLVGALGIAVVLWYGGLMVLGEELTIGVLVLFVNYLDRFFQPIRDLANFFHEMQSAMAAAEKIFGVIDTEPTIIDGSGARPLGRARGEIAFQGVSFAYDGQNYILRDVDLHIKAGTRVALVGATGAGKTSVVNLLARFYDPQRGRILLDGHDLRDLEVTSLRGQLGLVPQEPFLFSGTIADNIRYGCLDASDEEVRCAARSVNADRFISRLERGFDTRVGERGIQLSLGERQLIAFARALLRNPPVLVLDEATANVDAQAEELIQQALETILADRTAIVIAHRLSTVRDSHLIVVMEEGRIVERGSHGGLLAADGRYAELYKAYFQPWAV